MSFVLTKYHVVTPPVLDNLSGTYQRVVFATRSAETRIVNEAGWRMLQSGNLDALPPEMLQDLVDAKLLVPCGEDELSAILTRNNAAARDNDSLSIVIQPTAFCQLGCAYCGQAHTNNWLSDKHQNGIVARVAAKLDARPFRHLQIRWFGGEPLSGIAEMRSLSPHLKDLATSHNCTYSALIVTNGVALTHKIATELVNDHSVRSIHVTLDGVAEFHDARRYRKDGQPTFAPIFANVVSLARRSDLNCEIKIRANVDRYNYEGISPLLRMLAEAGVQRRISFYTSPVYSWGNDADQRSLTPREFADREMAWLVEMIELGFPMGLTPAPKPVVCVAVDPNSDVVDAMGTLFNCTEVPYVPAYGSPNKFMIGDVTNGELPGRREVLGSFNARVARGEYPCSSCNMLPVCGGACPKSWMEGHEPCPSAKYNIEGRLLLAYANSRIPARALAVAPEVQRSSPAVELRVLGASPC